MLKKRRPTTLTLPALPGTLSATAWALPATLRYPEFEKLCRAFGGGARGLSNQLQWMAGDLIVYGERRYGEQTYQALEFLGFDERTLTNLARVASAFLPARRRALPLSFAHHAEVAALHPEEQDEWLDRAKAKKWTRADLRKAIKGATKPAAGGRDDAATGDPWDRLRAGLDIVKEAREKLDRFPEHIWTHVEVKDLLVRLEAALFVEGR